MIQVLHSVYTVVDTQAV